jgi:hypothetical protein
MNRRTWSLSIVLIAAVICGCARSRAVTSTGLSYWPPGSPQRELPPELTLKTKATSKP